MSEGSDERRLIIIGTEPRDPAGGIGIAMSGFIAAAEAEGLLAEFVPTFDPRAALGRIMPAFRAVPRLRAAIRKVRERGLQPVVYSHAGGPVSIFREAVLLRLSRASGARTMMQQHAPDLDRWLRWSWSRVALRVAFAAADRICVLTPYWHEVMQASRIRQPVAVIPDPLPPAAEKEARRPLAADRRHRTSYEVLAMTRLVRGKGVDIAIEATARIAPECRLHIAGDGTMRTRYEELAHGLDVAGRVIFHGWVSGEQKVRLLRDADIFCLPSTYDSFGMGFIESMAYGLPVVAVRVGSAADVVKEGTTGLLVEKADPELVARALLALRDPVRRQAMGQAGKDWVLEQFSLASVGRRIRAAIC